MSLPACSPLEGIASVADGLLSFLATHNGGQRSTVPSRSEGAPSLQLPDVDSQSLHQALSKRNISPLIVSSSLTIFERRYGQLVDDYTSQWQRLISPLFATIGSTSLKGLVDITHRKFADTVAELESSIADTIDRRIALFQAEAEASAHSELESSSEDGMIIPRGHSRLAVKILEKAYSRTTNISRAEKNRLAAATGLQPRQVTIWFQNRRNRKVPPTAAKPAEEPRSPTVTPIKPNGGSKKRKAGGLYDGEIRQPSQRLRTTTPENATHRHVLLTSCSSASSTTSSVDSLASFCNGVAGKDRNYSTETSDMDTFDTVYSGKGLMAGSTSFDDQLDWQANRMPSIIVKSEEGHSSALIFSDTGRTQLDFDDLGLDLHSFEDELPSFDMSEVDFFLPQGSTSTAIGTQPAQAHSEVNRTPRQPTFAVPCVPTTNSDAANAINSLEVSAEEELKRAKQIEDWAFGMGLLIEEGDEEEDPELYLNLSGLSTRKNSPATDSMSTSGSISGVTTPQDLFDFSMEGLCLDAIFNANLSSYHDRDSDYETVIRKRPQDLSIDVAAADAYQLDDAMATARDARHEVSAR